MSRRLAFCRENVERTQTKQMESRRRFKIVCASRRKTLLRILFVHLCCHRGVAGKVPSVQETRKGSDGTVLGQSNA